ncbi:MAG: hypothetical protein JNK05_28905 [Myxococcales bacterium]|nr:hypothetical protein [Myxococcales bacterium]
MDGEPSTTGETLLDLDALGLEQGGHILVLRALRAAGAGARVCVRGSHPDLALQLSVFAREGAHKIESLTRAERDLGAVVAITVGASVGARAHGASRAGSAKPERGAIAPRADGRWGLAARGALVEAGAPSWDFSLVDRDVVWADEAKKLYAQALASQWDPEVAIPWSAPIEHPPFVEDAVVQVMTYLVENENAALLVPARFLGRIHPHFREVVQLLAIQLADEARHVEVFTRRALLRRDELALSTVGGQRSLQTLFEESDFVLSTLLLSVLGEGSFADLLWFLHEHAPDPVTRTIAQLTARDESRHVAAGMAHVHFALEARPEDRSRARAAIEHRHVALQHTSGLNAEVFDALVLLAAGGLEPAAIGRGFDAVQSLQRRMHEGRQRRLERLGFTAEDAASLAGLHTRNFM